ncbi:sensor histidine kinase [Clostridium sp. B9]|uniref:sensor histidine kinase n=1 Tax=Clostridium sp. B9 TaxID=3423224 RepID=UPI003D2EA6D2
MYLIDFIKIFYIIYLIAIGGVIFYQLKNSVNLNRRIFFFLGSTLSMIIINFFIGIKVFSCVLEFFILLFLVYSMKLATLNRTILVTSLYALTVYLSRYILILTYSAMFYDLNVLKILGYNMIWKFFFFLVITLVAILYFLIEVIKDIVEKRVVSIARYTKMIMTIGIIIFLSEIIFDNVKIDSNIVYEASMISINISFYLGITYVCLYKKCRDFNTGVKVNLLERQLDYQKKYYEGIINNYDNTRKTLHDMNNHMSVIKYLIQNNDYDGLGNYLENFKSHMPSNGKKNICENRIVNAICLEKLGVCNEKGIDISFDMNIPSSIKIELVDLCIVFGNLLDNAIEACERIKNLEMKRFIKVSSKVYLNQLHISILNSKDNIIKKHNDNFITSKRNKKKHGIGLENVKYVVNKNKGYIDFKDSKESFQVNLYMSLKR